MKPVTERIRKQLRRQACNQVDDQTSVQVFDQCVSQIQVLIYRRVQSYVIFFGWRDLE